MILQQLVKVVFGEFVGLLIEIVRFEYEIGVLLGQAGYIRAYLHVRLYVFESLNLQGCTFNMCLDFLQLRLQ